MRMEIEPRGLTRPTMPHIRNLLWLIGPERGDDRILIVVIKHYPYQISHAE
jgi:hypothetical protein